MLLVPLTVAVNCWVSPLATVAEEGVTVKPGSVGVDELMKILQAAKTKAKPNIARYKHFFIKCLLMYRILSQKITLVRRRAGG